jgi:hypothetical protein
MQKSGGVQMEVSTRNNWTRYDILFDYVIIDSVYVQMADKSDRHRFRIEENWLRIPTEKGCGKNFLRRVKPGKIFLDVPL